MNDQSEAPKVWALKGEAVTCINGHAIVDIAHNIYVGDRRTGVDFTNWHQPEPDLGASVAEIRCVECRGVWVRGKDGYQFHFGAGEKGGWR